MSSEKAARTEIGRILVAIWPWQSKGYVLVPSSAQLRKEGGRMVSLGGSPVRSGSTAASAQSIAKLGPELD